MQGGPKCRQLGPEARQSTVLFHEDRNFHFHFGLRHCLIDVIVQCHVQEGDLAEKLALISPTCHD